MADPLMRPERPGHEFVDALGGMIRQAGQHVGEPSLWIDVVELGGLCRPPNYAERVRYCAPLSRWRRRSRARQGGAAVAHLVQEPADDWEMADDGPRGQAALGSQVGIELLEDPFVRDERR